ncbi:MAG: HAD family phosphatase [Bacteroidetes bacterium]|uniref:HAD family phosphatase n=1 Tax=Candidatus Cryptobacteroides intestinavium TaxID=2840766 RepID=A0A9D9HIZ9_9BACT|nr:HAD family phosphatase [Candidatus Cryptobacteroides intestinavium]
MDSIKNIVFDFGGVLIDWNPRYLYREYFNDDRKMEDFLSGICTNEWNSEQDRGRPFDEGVKLLEERFPQYTEAIRMYRDRWGDMLGGEIPGTAALLMRLKGLGYGIYGLTNWSAETFPTAYSRYAVLHEFDGIVVSGQEKLIKPDPRIFEILLERYGLNACECIFIDDSRANIEAAGKLGFNTVLFDNIGSVTRQVAALTGESGLQ